MASGGGRGRGRGVVQLRQPTSDPSSVAGISPLALRKPGAGRPSSSPGKSAAAPVEEKEKPLPPSLNSLLKSAVGEILTDEKKATKAAEKFLESVTTLENVQELSERILAFCDAERAKPLAVLCNGLSVCWQDRGRMEANKNMAQFRSQLLKSFGGQYERRAELREKSADAFLGFVYFLAYLYSKLKIADAPPSFLAVPVVECLKELTSSQDEVDSFLELVEEVGELMGNHSEMDIDGLCTFCREQLLVEACPLWKRCALLQVLELRSSKWQLSSGTRKEYDTFSDRFRA